MQTVKQVLETRFVKDKITQVFGKDETELVTRHAESGASAPTSFFLKRRNEQDLYIERLIILPPHGYTANMPTWMNSHEEAHQAMIEVLGGVRAGHAAFSKLKKCIELAHAPKADSSAALNVPYMETSDRAMHATLITSGARLHVVKPNGFGFYHNLTNKTDDWLVIKLEKHLRPMKGVDAAKFPPKMTALATEYYEAVKRHGDEIFHAEPQLVERIINDADPHQAIPALIEMLNIYDAGKHEACTVFATLLQIGRKHPAIFHEYADRALKENFEPAFYLKQLSQKINRAVDGRPDGRTWVAGAPPKSTGFSKHFG